MYKYLLENCFTIAVFVKSSSKQKVFKRHVKVLPLKNVIRTYLFKQHMCKIHEYIL